MLKSSARQIAAAACAVLLIAVGLSGCGIHTIPTQQEQTVLTQVIQARAKATQTTVNLPSDVTSNPEAFQKFEQSQAGLTQALGRLMVVVERYPDLKSNQNFMVLQSQLEGTENRIAVAGRDYIHAV